VAKQQAFERVVFRAALLGARKGMADAAATDTGVVRDGFFSNDERQVFSGQWF